jgi:RNA polymerase sigma factor (sigma-70 family)
MRERVLATLSPENQRLWQQFYIDGLTVKEIANMEGITERAIQRRLKRVKTAFEKFYKK